MQIGTTSVEGNLQHLSKLQMQIPLTSSSSVRNTSYDTCAQVKWHAYKVIHFSLVWNSWKHWKHSTCLSMGNWLNKLWLFPHNRIIWSYIFKNKICIIDMKTFLRFLCRIVNMLFLLWGEKKKYSYLLTWR